ncbi:hypothetical protein [Haloferula sp. BvORR071]|uniref:hypothetical protein n=1 Tax=Haloferula sp. BvORR071 TaxID=1396141 RepID=UPI000557A823|nr:hypothetical protein [Haloferula sp. BvORR071]
MRLRTKVIGVSLCFLLGCVYQFFTLWFCMWASYPEPGADRLEMVSNPKAELGEQMAKPITVPMMWLIGVTRPTTNDWGILGGCVAVILLILGWLLLSLAYGTAIFASGRLLLWICQKPARDTSDGWYDD